MHRKRDARLQRRGLCIELVPVEAHAGLEAKRVPGTQPGGGDPCIYKTAPDARGAARREVDLEPVLARISGPRDDGRNTFYFPFDEPEGLEAGKVHLGEVLQAFFGLWSLQGEKCP